MEDIVDITDFSMDFFSLKGKNAVVTGGNTGLGQAFSLALAKGGANLFIPSIIENTEIETLIKNEGVQVESMLADLTEKGTPEKIINRCVERFGSIDILINNAGLCINTPVEEFDRKPWDKMVEVNLTGAFEMTYEASKKMIPQKKGKIINICSLFSYLGGQWSPLTRQPSMD